jgi:hypothetical protein
MRHSITKVVNNKTPKELEQINKTKDGPQGWALRGTTIHRFMELFLTTGDPGDLGQWAEYIEPALKHRLWKTYEPVAVEYRCCDLARSIGGSFDALLRNKDMDGGCMLAWSFYDADNSLLEVVGVLGPRLLVLDRALLIGIPAIQRVDVGGARLVDLILQLPPILGDRAIHPHTRALEERNLQPIGGDRCCELNP